MLRFDLARVLRLKLGKFFGFLFVFILLVLCVQLYVKHLVNTSAGLSTFKPFADQLLSQGPEFQARLLHPVMLQVLWLQVALVGGGLVARDTLHRIRPLIYAHPVRPWDYLLAKALFAAGLPLAIMLAYILLPWGLSLAVAGVSGPVWPTAPLLLVPAAVVIAALMGAVTLGASSLAASPKAGFGWALGILLGSAALGGVLSAALHDPRWQVLAAGNLTKLWPDLLLGANRDSGPGWVPVLLATALHLVLWTVIAVRRTRPSEASL
jgi:ABC-type transport system involved in multi-copper enzyme maturation permease subunit